jgi:hypothetical protein
MPSPRWLATLTIPTMVGAALVTSAATATMVNLARSTYCPNQRCWAAHC